MGQSEMADLFYLCACISPEKFGYLQVGISWGNAPCDEETEKQYLC